MLHGILHAGPLGRSSWRTPRLCLSNPIHRHLLTLAIESSCDDTCVAVLNHNGRLDQDVSNRETHVEGEDQDISAGATRLLFNEKITAANTGKGGIVPTEALDSHRANLAQLIDKAILSLPKVKSKSQGSIVSGLLRCRDGHLRRKPDFISVTRGPGMRSNLACGLDTAKGIAVAWQVPLVGVHHMQAHALTPRMISAMTRPTCQPSDHNPRFPFLTLLVSGGHTMLLHSTGLTEHQVLASTVDVAIGDALDKCGRMLLPEHVKLMAKDTAFGKHLSKYAFPDQSSFASWPVPRYRRDEINKPSNKFGWQIRPPLSDTRDLRFSFSSVTSETERILHRRCKEIGGPVSAEENLLLAQTAIGNAFEHLASRTLLALEGLKEVGVEIRDLVVSGGVAANDFLRFYLRSVLTIRGFQNVHLIFPPVEYCTDNAAMIAWAGMEMYESGFSSDLSIDAIRKWSMDPTNEDGGILGVGGWCHASSTPSI